MLRVRLNALRRPDPVFDELFLKDLRILRLEKDLVSSGAASLRFCDKRSIRSFLRVRDRC